MKSKILLFTGIVILILSGCAEKDHLITITTEYGEMKAILFDETPQHKETFLKMAEAGKYDSTKFHRVMNEFMIQGGDINQRPGNTEPETTLIPAEIRNNLIHTKGMIAGARTPDDVNPEKRSGTQFYIVHGRKYNRLELEQQNRDSYYAKCVARLNQMFQEGQQRDLLDRLLELQKANDIAAVQSLVFESVPIIEARFGKISQKEYTEDQYLAYEQIGGAPFLDGEYTVYGQVIEGLEVIDKIAAVQTTGSPSDRPLSDIYLTVTVEEVAKSKISKDYNYNYPESIE